MGRGAKLAFLTASDERLMYHCNTQAKVPLQHPGQPGSARESVALCTSSDLMESKLVNRDKNLPIHTYTDRVALTPKL